MIEAYQAYGDYRSMMDLTEACIVDAIRATGQPLTLAWGDKTIDFTPPFARKTYDELFAELLNVDATNAAAVVAFAKSIGLETAGKHADVVARLRGQYRKLVADLGLRHLRIHRQREFGVGLVLGLR